MIAALVGMVGVVIVMAGRQSGVDASANYFALATAICMALAFIFASKVENGTLALPSLGGTLMELEDCAFPLLRNVTATEARRLVIAYEPIWAIGTGSTASPEVAAEAHAIIRGELAHCCGQQMAQNTRILYGGSVKPDNIASLMQQEQIDGALVGGASLVPATFAGIVHYT